MIKVNYHYINKNGNLLITDLVADGHAVGSDTNLLNVRVCAGVSAVLVGSKRCFDFTHTQVIETTGHFEVHVGKYADKNDYAVTEVLVHQLDTIYENYGSLFMKIVGKEVRDYR